MNGYFSILSGYHAQEVFFGVLHLMSKEFILKMRSKSVHLLVINLHYNELQKKNIKVTCLIFIFFLSVPEINVVITQEDKVLLNQLLYLVFNINSYEFCGWHMYHRSYSRQ